jgi:hypothetical protein
VRGRASLRCSAPPRRQTPAPETAHEFARCPRRRCVLRQARRRAAARPQTLPHLAAAEHPRITRARLAAFLQSQVAATGQVTVEDIAAAGFTDAERDRHFTEAKRIARLTRMAA